MRDYLFFLGVLALALMVTLFVCWFVITITGCPDGMVRVNGAASGCVPWEVVYGNP